MMDVEDKVREVVNKVAKEKQKVDWNGIQDQEKVAPHKEVGEHKAEVAEVKVLEDFLSTEPSERGRFVINFIAIFTKNIIQISII